MFRASSIFSSSVVWNVNVCLQSAGTVVVTMSSSIMQSCSEHANSLSAVIGSTKMQETALIDHLSLVRTDPNGTDSASVYNRKHYPTNNWGLCNPSTPMKEPLVFPMIADFISTLHTLVKRWWNVDNLVCTKCYFTIYSRQDQITDFCPALA